MSHPEPVDLSNCEREPIHIPGAIQPHGVLVACAADGLRVRYVSTNVDEAFGEPAGRVLGSTLASLLDAESGARLDGAVRDGLGRDVNPVPLVTRTGRAYEGIVHRSTTDGLLVLELEAPGGSVTGFHPTTRAAVRRLQSATDRQRLCDITAEEVRRLTGFDRVMVYRFDQDWNGEVVAESRRQDLEPFLGLHYPAADIPAQARRLYTLNWLRIIPDIAYRPCPIVTADADGVPLDLSFATLRSVSPIHVEYLQNMGVSASMSVSLVRDDTLIGLVACHHYSGPHHVPFAVRETCEFLGQALSWHLTSIEGREGAELAADLQRAESAIVAAISTARSMPEGICTPPLLHLTGASGAALLYEGRTHTVGTVPNDASVARIVEALRPPAGQWLSWTDHVSSLVPEAADWDGEAAGAMLLEISRDLGEYVVWFRPATDRVVDWAGDPRKSVTTDDTAFPPRLSPRGSFALWREVVKGRATAWEPWAREAAMTLRRSMLGGMRRRVEELRLLSEQLYEADRLKNEFLATVGHELRTPLNAIVGWLHLLRQEAASSPRAAQAIETIERNAKAQSRLVDDLLDISRIVSGKLTFDVAPVNVAGIAEASIAAVRPAATAKHIRLQSALDSTALVLGDASRLQQVFTNLLSNATKFTPREGRVQVFVEKRDSSVEVTVADTGQGIDAEFLPYVFDRFRQADSGLDRRTSGLGLGLAIARHIVELHGGTIAAASEGQGRGATFTVRLPLSVAVRKASTRVDSPARRSLDCPPELAGLRVLVVEDDADANAMMTAMLQECEAEVATAFDAQGGLDLVSTFKPDVIVSDVGLPVRDGYWFISQLRERSREDGGMTPAVAVTAHARVEDRAQALYAGFNNHVPKPIDPIELFAVIAALRRQP